MEQHLVLCLKEAANMEQHLVECPVCLKAANMEQRLVVCPVCHNKEAANMEQRLVLVVCPVWLKQRIRRRRRIWQRQAAFPF